MIGLAVVADDFVYALYGEKWAAAIPVIQVLALAGLGQSVGITVELIYTAMGRTELMLKWVLFVAPVLLGSFVVGLPWGAFGVAVAYVVAQYTILWYPMWWLAGGLIDLKFTVAMKNLFKPLVCAVSMAVCVWLARIVLPTDLSSALRLCAQATGGVAAYAIAVHFVKVEAYSLLRDRLRLVLFRPARG
jgi:PST family polysaccharide transporter